MHAEKERDQGVGQRKWERKWEWDERTESPGLI